MSMAICTECSQPLSTTAPACPHCGAPAAVALRVPAADPADWPEALEAAVRAALQWPEGELAAAQLAQVESVKLDEVDAADLTKFVAGLRGLPALKWLGLSRAGIADAGPLSELVGLRYLYLEKNHITDIAPLRELKQLKQLWLYGNPLEPAAVAALEEALPKCEVFI
mgnify:FL=1